MVSSFSNRGVSGKEIQHHEHKKESQTKGEVSDKEAVLDIGTWPVWYVYGIPSISSCVLERIPLQFDGDAW